MTNQGNFAPSPVILEGKTVRLEPLSLKHAAGLLAIGAEESIWQYLSTPAPTSMDKVHEWIEERLANQAAGERLPVAVISLADGHFAGSTGYSSISRQHRTLEIASWYGLNYQRTGINTECKYLLLKYAFEDLGALRVSLNVDMENARSRRAVERIGGVQEGLLRKHRIRRDGTRRDTVIFGFINDDWPQVKVKLEELMNR